MGAKAICPQTRTLMFWAAKYFDAWLVSKDTFESAYPARVQSRGWKDGTMNRFFQIKDLIFQEKFSDYNSQEHGEGVFNVYFSFCLLYSDSTPFLVFISNETQVLPMQGYMEEQDHV